MVVSYAVEFVIGIYVSHNLLTAVDNSANFLRLRRT